MTKAEWERLIRVTDQIAFIISNLSGIPENICSGCYQTLTTVQADLLEIMGRLALVDTTKTYVINESGWELQ